MSGDTLTCSIGTLQRSSFRGIDFWVRDDAGTYGRRYAHHEYPKGETPFNEDMGRKQREFKVNGYVVGDDAASQKDALIAAVEMYGGGLLVLPAEAPQQCVCDSMSVSRNKDDQGIFNLAFDFKEDPSFGIGAFTTGSAFESLIGGVFTRAAPAVSALFNATFAYSNILPYVVDNAIARVQTFAQAMTEGIESFSLPDDTLVVRTMSDLISLHQNADAYVRSGSASALSYDLSATMARVFDAVMNVKDPSVTVSAMLNMAYFSPLEEGGVMAGSLSDTPVLIYAGGSTSVTFSVTPSRYSPSEEADRQNAAAFNNTVRVYALIGLAKGLSAVVFTDRKSAIQARANMVELFQQQMERVQDYDVALALEDARDYCVKSIVDQITSIEPLVHVSSPITLPSIYWAGRLYNDASRALELSERNSVRTPAYMPQEFDALSR